MGRSLASLLNDPRKKSIKMQEFESDPATKKSFMDNEDFKNTSIIAWMKSEHTME